MPASPPHPTLRSSNLCSRKEGLGRGLGRGPPAATAQHPMVELALGHGHYGQSRRVRPPLGALGFPGGKAILQGGQADPGPQCLPEPRAPTSLPSHRQLKVFMSPFPKPALLSCPLPYPPGPHFLVWGRKCAGR